MPIKESEPHPSVVTPRWSSPAALATELEEKAGYIADPDLAMTIYLALKLGRPLFLEGEPGVGKTSIATSLSRLLGGRLTRLQCYEGMGVHQVLYDWNYSKQALTIRTAEHQKDVFTEDYLLARPLLEVARASAGSSPVLLIDELDRADAPIEAMLLEFLSDYSVTIPEVGTIRSKQVPIIVITSNRTRNIHDAVKRRSFYHWLDYPDVAREKAIIRTHLPSMSEDLARQIAGFLAEVRELELNKSPGVAETLDWARALTLLGYQELDVDCWQETTSALLKTREDLSMLKADTTIVSRSKARAARLS